MSMNPFWWRKDRGKCLICFRPLGKRKLSHVIDPPPFCLGAQKPECEQILRKRVDLEM